nr:reverse transcriptase domain-containing protein [Tanacetum cinerariifolium]
MATLADKAFLSGADNRPPMLKKDMYDSWKSRMELYMMNRQHGQMILESVQNGPLIWPTIGENGLIRPRKYSELTLVEAIQATCDVKATNIIFQGAAKGNFPFSRLRTSNFAFRECDTPDSPPSQDPYETVVAQWRSRVAARSSPPSSPIRQILPAPPGLPRRPAFLFLPNFLNDSSIIASVRPSRKRCRSLSVLISSPMHIPLSPICANLSPPPKRIREFDSVMELEVSLEDGYQPYVPREVGLGVDIKDSHEPYTEPDADSDIQAYINECIAYADAIKTRGMNDRDVVETATEEEIESRERHANGAIEVTYETLGERVEADVAVSDSMIESMSNATRTGMTQDTINELIAKRMDEALKAYDAAINPKIKAEIKSDQQGHHIKENFNNGNDNGNGNGNPNVNNEEVMETVFHISNCPPRYQVKYASCTLMDGTLTWWNSYKRTIGVDAVYAMTWMALMKLMTEDAIRVANNLIDQKMKGYDIKNAENKRRNNVERKGYIRVFPYCNKCRIHHEGLCMAKCGNCKRVGHMTIDYRTVVAATP